MKKLLFSAFISLLTINAFSQVNIGEFLNSGAANAKILTQEYMKPYGDMLGSSLNSGWYTSAKPHKLLGFDVTFTGTYTMAPNSVKSFDLNALKLANTAIAPGSSTMAPTISGGSGSRPELIVTDPLGGETSFNLPKGKGKDSFITPMVTAGVGLPFGVELKGRFMPNVSIGDFEAGLWGIGVQKDVKDYIPGVKHVPILNISVLAAYTDYTTKSGVGSVDGLITNGSIDIAAKAYTTRLLIGANLPLVAFYTGVGYGSSSTDLGVLGDYEMDPIDGSQMDPIKLEYTTNSFDMNVGMRVRLGVIAFHADYTVGEYSSITAGLGISFR